MYKYQHVKVQFGLIVFHSNVEFLSSDDRNSFGEIFYKCYQNESTRDRNISALHQVSFIQIIELTWSFMFFEITNRVGFKWFKLVYSTGRVPFAAFFYLTQQK